ncbi:MAG: Omp28-related outer membrane protein, partial [bacterium]
MILIFFLCSGGFSAERVVLLELFTSSTCGPCFFANSYLDTTYSSEDENVSLIRYHVWWPAPGNDPFYLANPYPNRARVNFYNIDAVPTLVVDGGVRDESYTAWGMIIEARRSLPSPVELYAYMSEFGRARIKITANESFQTGSQRLFFVIVEDSIRYNAPNGQRIFHQVMREMFPNSTGKLVFVAAGETTGTELDYYIKPEWNEDNIHAVIFLQNEFSKEVYQSVKVSLPPRPEYAFYVNVPMSKAFVAAGDSVVLPFTVVNTGSSV